MIRYKDSNTNKHESSFPLLTEVNPAVWLG